MKDDRNTYIDFERTKCILQTLVRTDTCQPEGNERQLGEQIKAMFEGRACCTYICHDEKRYSLIVKIEGIEDSGGIAFLGHLDTVACGNKNEWSFPPLSGAGKSGQVYGRGTVDMKGGVTSMIMTAKYLLEHKAVLKRPVYFCFTADEENAGTGARSLVEHPWLKSVEEVIICEPTEGKIGLCEKGTLWLQITVKGRSAHGASPQKGINALKYLIQMCEDIEQEILEKRKDSHVLLGRGTVTLTKMNGGTAPNIVPDYAEAVLDIRTVPGEPDHDMLLKAVDNKAGKLTSREEQLDIDIKILNNRPALEVPQEADIVKRMAKILEGSHRSTEYIGVSYYTDGSLIIPKWNVPFLIMGPGKVEKMHCINESISVEEVQAMAENYINYVKNYFCI